MGNKVFLSFVVCAALICCTLTGRGQGMAINATGATAHNSALLDVSSTTQGVLVPRMTSAQRVLIASPATGLLVYQTDGTTGFYFYDGTAWTSLSGSGGGSPTGSAGGDLTGTYPNPTLTTSGVTSGTYGSATQVPSYTVNSKGRITSASNITITGVTPGGSAGGDMSGTYPNPTVANSAISSAKILDGTIVNGDVSTTASIAYSKLNLLGSVGISDHSATGTASSSTFLRGDNTWATPTATPSGSAGGDLTGTYPNPSVANSAVTSAKILDGTIVNGDVSTTASIAYSKLNLLGSVGISDHSATGTASSSTFLRGDNTWATPTATPSGSAGGDLTGTYPNPSVANSAVTSAKILDGTIVNGDVSTTAAIAYSKLNLLGSVGISDHSATGTASSSTFLRGDNTWATPTATPSGSAGGDLTGTFPNPSIASGAVTSTKIADGTILNSDVNTSAAIAYSKLNLTGSIALTDMSTTGTASSSTFLRGDNTWATPTATPSGSAGGSLSGTYPNPSLANGSVTISKISATGTASSSTYLRGDGTWATPSGGASVTMDLDAANTAVTSVPIGGSAVAPVALVFNTLLTSPSLGSYNTGTGVYTVGSSGVYMINVHVISSPGSGAVGLFPILLINGGIYTYGTAAGSANLPAPAVRGELTFVTYLSSSNTVSIKVSNANTAAACNVTTDGTTRWTITKLSN